MFWLKVQSQQKLQIIDLNVEVGMMHLLPLVNCALTGVKTSPRCLPPEGNPCCQIKFPSITLQDHVISRVFLDHSSIISSAQSNDMCKGNE